MVLLVWWKKRYKSYRHTPSMIFKKETFWKFQHLPCLQQVLRVCFQGVKYLLMFFFYEQTSKWTYIKWPKRPTWACLVIPNAVQSLSAECPIVSLVENSATAGSYKTIIIWCYILNEQLLSFESYDIDASNFKICALDFGDFCFISAYTYESIIIYQTFYNLYNYL